MVHPVQSVVESLYANGRCPRLHVNAMGEGVVCPEFIREQWQERLIIDLDSSYPLDLQFEELGITANLSFGGYVTRCTFPWTAIYVVADRATGRGIVLDQNMPDSVRRSRQTQTTGLCRSATGSKPSTTRPALIHNPRRSPRRPSPSPHPRARISRDPARARPTKSRSKSAGPPSR